MVHIHVRDPATGRGSRDVALYRAVVERIRASGADPVLNLTAGMGGDLVLGGTDEPLPPDAAGTDMVGAEERLAHVAALRPEICTLDCGSMNFAAGGDYVMVNTPDMLRAMAERIRALGVRPELEVFDTGQLVLVAQLLREGLIEPPPLVQLCTGIPYGAPDDPLTLMAWSPGCRRARCSPPSPSARCSCPTSPWPRWPAATSAWGSRTTSTCRGASWPRTRSSSSARSPSWRRWGRACSVPTTCASGWRSTAR